MVFNDIKSVDKVVITVILTIFLIIFVLSIVNKFHDNVTDFKNVQCDIVNARQNGYNGLNDYYKHKNEIVDIVKEYERNKTGDSIKKLSSSMLKNSVRGLLIGICFTRTVSGSIIHAIITCVVVTIIDFTHLLT